LGLQSAGHDAHHIRLRVGERAEMIGELVKLFVGLLDASLAVRLALEQEVYRPFYFFIGHSSVPFRKKKTGSD
jgi:hypothetical protein